MDFGEEQIAPASEHRATSRVRLGSWPAGKVLAGKAAAVCPANGNRCRDPNETIAKARPDSQEQGGLKATGWRSLTKGRLRNRQRRYGNTGEVTAPSELTKRATGSDTEVGTPSIGNGLNFQPRAVAIA